MARQLPWAEPPTLRSRRLVPVRGSSTLCGGYGERCSGRLRSISAGRGRRRFREHHLRQTQAGWLLSGVPVVQALEEFVSCELDFLVAPFGCPVLACDDAHAVDAAEVSVDERVPGLAVVAGPLGEPEVPLGVFLPRV